MKHPDVLSTILGEMWNDFLSFPLPLDWAFHVYIAVIALRCKSNVTFHLYITSQIAIVATEKRIVRTWCTIWRSPVRVPAPSRRSRFARCPSASPPDTRTLELMSEELMRESIGSSRVKFTKIEVKEKARKTRIRRRDLDSVITWPGEEDGRKDEKLDLWHVSVRDAARHTSRLYEMHRITTLTWSA